MSVKCTWGPLSMISSRMRRANFLSTFLKYADNPVPVSLARVGPVIPLDDFCNVHLVTFIIIIH